MSRRYQVGLLVGGLLAAGCFGLWRSQQPAPSAPSPEVAQAPAPPPPLPPPPDPVSPEDSASEGTVPLDVQREAFAEVARLALMSAGERGEIRYEPQGFLLRVGAGDGGSGGTLYLTNLFEEYRRATSQQQRVDVLRRLVGLRNAPDVPDTYAEAKARLMPSVRGRAYFESMRLMRPGWQGPGVAWRPWAEVLGVALVYDGPDTMQYINEDSLAKWGVTYEQALAVAVENLRRKSAEPWLSRNPGICESPWEDNYAASRLLLDEVLKRCQVKGDPVVLVPHRDLLLITGSLDEDGLTHAAERASAAWNTPRFINGHALRRTPKGWQIFLPERVSNAYESLKLLAVLSEERDYQEQKERLEKIHARDGVDIFIASYVPRKDDKERVRGNAIWVKGVDTLLPRADIIVLVDPADGDPRLGQEARPRAAVRWDWLVRDAGPLLERDETLYPERYRLKGFPSPRLLERWRQAGGGLEEVDP